MKEIEWITQLKQGNMIAFDHFYNLYSKKLYHFGFRMLKTKDDAEELVQDVFSRVWEKRENLDEYRSFQAYLFAIAYNYSVDLLRKKIKDQKYVDYTKSIQNSTSAINSTYEEIEFSELEARVNKVLNQLPDRQKEVFILSRDEKLTYREIADRLRISVNTVEVHMSRALKFLREKLDDNSLAFMLFFYLFLSA